jgi:hypothetical protein
MATRKNTKAAAAPATEVEELDTSLADALEDVAEQVDPLAAKVEQAQANIERAVSMAEAENAEGLAELEKEHEALVSGMPQRGNIPARYEGEPPMSWAAFKKGSRDDFRKAAKAQPKAEQALAKQRAEIERKAQAAAPDVTTDYTLTEGVKELVDAGAAKVHEGVMLHVKTAQTARSIAGMLLDARRRIVTKEGVPDLKATTQASRNASSDMYGAAETRLAEESGDADHAKDLVKRLGQAVRNQMSDVLVEYIKELDTDGAKEEWAQHYGKVAAAHPELTPSEAVFKFYGINPVSRRELAAARQAERSGRLAELEAAAKGGDEEAEAEAEELRAETVTERIAGDMRRAEAAINAAVKAAKAADLSAEDKLALKAKAAELMALVAAL